jgi:hypothetical protein
MTSTCTFDKQPPFDADQSIWEGCNQFGIVDYETVVRQSAWMAAIIHWLLSIRRADGSLVFPDTSRPSQRRPWLSKLSETKWQPLILTAELARSMVREAALDVFLNAKLMRFASGEATHVLSEDQNGEFIDLLSRWLDVPTGQRLTEAARNHKNKAENKLIAIGRDPNALESADEYALFSHDVRMSKSRDSQIGLFHRWGALIGMLSTKDKLTITACDPLPGLTRLAVKLAPHIKPGSGPFQIEHTADGRLCILISVNPNPDSAAFISATEILDVCDGLTVATDLSLEIRMITVAADGPHCSAIRTSTAESPPLYSPEQEYSPQELRLIDLLEEYIALLNGTESGKLSDDASQRILTTLTKLDIVQCPPVVSHFLTKVACEAYLKMRGQHEENAFKLLLKWARSARIERSISEAAIARLSTLELAMTPTQRQRVIIGLARIKAAKELVRHLQRFSS